MKFKVGDRVAVYGWVKDNGYNYGSKGIVRYVNAPTELLVHFDHGFEMEVHPKQCRKLIKKERRRVWIWNPEESHDPKTSVHQSALSVNFAPISNGIEFVEVKRK